MSDQDLMQEFMNKSNFVQSEFETLPKTEQLEVLTELNGLLDEIIRFRQVKKVDL